MWICLVGGTSERHLDHSTIRPGSPVKAVQPVATGGQFMTPQLAHERRVSHATCHQLTTLAIGINSRRKIVQCEEL